MPVVRDINIQLNLDEVLRRQEVLKPERLQPRMKSAIEELLGITDQLFEPSYVYQSYPVKQASEGQVVLETGDAFNIPDMVKVFSTANEVTAVMCTIGPRLEAAVQEFFSRNESLRGILLDGIGSAAVDVVSREACRRIGNQVQTKGLTASSPLSPGMGNIPLEEQRRLFGMLPAAEIGAVITSTNMIIPRKSVTMYIGIGKDMPRWHPVEVCERCRLKDSCKHRRYL